MSRSMAISPSTTSPTLTKRRSSSPAAVEAPSGTPKQTEPTSAESRRRWVVFQPLAKPGGTRWNAPGSLVSKTAGCELLLEHAGAKAADADGGRQDRERDQEGVNHRQGHMVDVGDRGPKSFREVDQRVDEDGDLEPFDR